ncbi:MAG: hypothetical protein IJ599_02910 [Alphaproteobacteria bacterium]|nr:hypothetical protein [Alphaproteobacteria bacterium]
MLVEYEGGIRLVYGLNAFSSGHWFYVLRKSEPDFVLKTYKWATPELISEFPEFFEVFTGVDVLETKVIDPSIPPNWVSQCRKNWCPCYTLFPKGFERRGEYLWDDFTELYDCILDYERTLIANEMLAFHGLPTIKIPPECIPEPYHTEAEQRLIDELNSCLEYADK